MGQDKSVICAIGAVASNGMLGLSDWLPWDIPEELAYFERMVDGAALVIGRLTYESMDVVPVDSFIVSRQADLKVRAGCTRVATVEAGLRAALASGKRVFVIGGASVYAAAWPYCHRFYLTRIEQAFAGDTVFPAEIPLDDWIVEAESTQTFRENKTGRDVLCRFIQYRQPHPLPLPVADCGLEVS